jgi:microcystin-dependent protein
MEAFMALICAFGASFAPAGWAFCYGQLMSISQNSALFALLGTTYGGNGQTTFGLPDLRGRAPIGTGPSTASGTNYVLGQLSGVESVVLTIGNVPLHNHPVDANLIVSSSASTAAGTTATPGPTLVPAVLPTIGGGPSATPIKGYAVKNDSTTLAPATVTGSVGFAGGNQAFGIMNPYLAINYIIALQGIFPSRN